MTHVRSSNRRIIRKRVNPLFLILISLVAKQPLFSEELIQFNFNNVELKSALQILIIDHNIAIIFPDNIPNTLVDARCDSCSINETLNLILSSTDLTWEKNNIQFIVKGKESIPYFKISGRVIDQTTNSPIPHANIFISNSSLGDISNHDGIFSISNIYTKSCSLIISYIGYDQKIIELQFPNNNRNDYEIALKPKVLTTKEISIFGLPKEFMDRSNNPGQVSFSPRHIASLPNLGEVDIFRSLQFLPGVQLGLGETSELYIRGGSPDQNLVLLDLMPIYQTGHMFGFISGISANAVKDIQVYKGGIPPRYGGRISSVIDISSKTGNINNIRGAMYGNLMSQGILTEIPISKRGSYIINIRKSSPSSGYSKLYNAIHDYVTGNDQFNLLNESASKENNQNTFYDTWSSYEDVIGKVSLLINPIHRLTITHINGVDSVLEDREYFGFNAILGSDSVEIKENSNIGNKGLVLNLFSNWNSNYNSHLSIYQNSVDISYTSLLRQKSTSALYLNTNEANEENNFLDRSVRFHQEYNGANKHKISTGFQENIFQLKKKVDFKDGSSNNSYITLVNAYAHSFYFEDQWIVNNPLRIQSGIRFTYYDLRKKFYQEPRISIKYRILDSLSLEAAIGKHHQFIHRLTNKITIQNSWIFSSNDLPIISSLNSHIGVNWNNLTYSISLSGYHRSLKNLYRIKDSFSIFDNESSRDIILGEGEKKGLELILRKKNGSVRGWLSYHLNQTSHKFPDYNNNQSFLADFDKLNEFKIVAITRVLNYDLTANWVFSSGANYTNIDNMYVEAGTGYTINSTGEINEERLPYVHHLDVAISREWMFKSVLFNLGFSIYNIYNKSNISHKRYNPYTPQLSVSNVFMLGITPSINLKVSF